MLNDQELADRRALIAGSSGLRQLLVRIDARAVFLPVELDSGRQDVRGDLVVRAAKHVVRMTVSRGEAVFQLLGRRLRAGLRLRFGRVERKESTDERSRREASFQTRGHLESHSRAPGEPRSSGAVSP